MPTWQSICRVLSDGSRYGLNHEKTATLAKAHDEPDHELLERFVDEEDGHAHERDLARALKHLEPEASEQVRVQEEAEVRRLELVEHGRRLLPHGRRAERLSVRGPLGARPRAVRRHARKVGPLQLRNDLTADREAPGQCAWAGLLLGCRTLALLLSALVEPVDVLRHLLRI
jgi:hypothetical protein